MTSAEQRRAWHVYRIMEPSTGLGRRAREACKQCGAAAAAARRGGKGRFGECWVYRGEEDGQCAGCRWSRKGCSFVRERVEGLREERGGEVVEERRSEVGDVALGEGGEGGDQALGDRGEGREGVDQALGYQGEGEVGALRREVEELRGMVGDLRGVVRELRGVVGEMKGLVGGGVRG